MYGCVDHGLRETGKKEDAVQEQTGKEDPYTSDFSIEYLDDGVKLVTDAEGRKMYLVPREAEIPGEAADEMVVRTPVERVGVYVHNTGLYAAAGA